MAEQVSVTPVVSLVSVDGPQPVVFTTVLTGSVTDQVTSTSLRYQPLPGSVPGPVFVPVIVGTTTGPAPHPFSSAVT